MSTMSAPPVATHPTFAEAFRNATIRIGRRALRHLLMWAAAAFGALFVLRVPFPLVVAGAAALGLVGVRFRPDVFTPPRHGAASAAVISDTSPLPPPTRPSTSRAVWVLALSLVLWFVPMLGLALWRGPADVLFREAVFSSARPPWSSSAAPTPSCPTWPSKRWRRTGG